MDIDEILQKIQECEADLREWDSTVSWYSEPVNKAIRLLQSVIVLLKKEL